MPVSYCIVSWRQYRMLYLTRIFCCVHIAVKLDWSGLDFIESLLVVFRWKLGLSTRSLTLHCYSLLLTLGVLPTLISLNFPIGLEISLWKWTILHVHKNCWTVTDSDDFAAMNNSRHRLQWWMVTAWILYAFVLTILWNKWQDAEF